MPSPIRVLVLAVVLATIPTLVTAQSLVEIAKQAADQRAANAAADKKTGRVTPPATPVYTNQDLPASTTPRAVPVVPSPPAPATPAPSPVEIRDAEAARDHEQLTARQRLLDAQQALRAGEQSQRDLQHTYDNTCSGRPTLETIRPCGDLRSALRVDMPASLNNLRTSIRVLAQQLGLDPDQAARSFSR